jgi:predicted nucleic acid-binding protein
LLELAPVVAAIPAHRLHAASAAVVIKAGILTGLMSRLGAYQPDQLLATLNDATLFLHALASGFVVLTRNLRDFDMMSQILGDGQVMFYDAAA